ncbi:MAG: hypothetical protein QM778_14005 [Myxococcales bacterium]
MPPHSPMLPAHPLARRVARRPGLVPAVALGIALSSGCLSIDTVPRKHPVADAGADTSTGPIPCIDRGTYTADGATYRGLGQTCDGELTCIDGVCLPLPACEAGSLRECSFTPAGLRGELQGFTLYEGYIYWMESGTTDERHNPLGDGALVRAKLGSWQREELVSQLNFYVEDQRQLVFADLVTTDDTALWSLVQGSERYPGGYLKGLSSDNRVSSKLANANWCAGHDSAYRAYDGLWIAPLDGTDTQVQLLQGGFGYFRCLVAGGRWLHVQDDRGQDIRMRIDGPGGQPLQPESSTVVTLLSTANDTHYFTRLVDGWIGRAEISDDPQPAWVGVAGPGTVISADSRFVYWLRPSPYVDPTSDWSHPARTDRVVFRTAVDGTGVQETIAEVLESVSWPSALGDTGGVQADASGVLWRRSGTELHFMPGPAN